MDSFTVEKSITLRPPLMLNTCLFKGNNFCVCKITATEMNTPTLSLNKWVRESFGVLRKRRDEPIGKCVRKEISGLPER